MNIDLQLLIHPPYEILRNVSALVLTLFFTYKYELQEKLRAKYLSIACYINNIITLRIEAFHFHGLMQWPYKNTDAWKMVELFEYLRSFTPNWKDMEKELVEAVHVFE